MGGVVTVKFYKDGDNIQFTSPSSYRIRMSEPIYYKVQKVVDYNYGATFDYSVNRSYSLRVVKGIVGNSTYFYIYLRYDIGIVSNNQFFTDNTLNRVEEIDGHNRLTTTITLNKIDEASVAVPYLYLSNYPEIGGITVGQDNIYRFNRKAISNNLTRGAIVNSFTRKNNTFTLYFTNDGTLSMRSDTTGCSLIENIELMDNSILITCTSTDGFKGVLNNQDNKTIDVPYIPFNGKIISDTQIVLTAGSSYKLDTIIPPNASCDISFYTY